MASPYLYWYWALVLIGQYRNGRNYMPLNSYDALNSGQEVMMERDWPVFLDWNELSVCARLVLILLLVFLVYTLYVLYRLNLVCGHYLRQFASSCQCIS